MMAWLREDLEQMDLHNVSFVLQTGVLIGLAVGVLMGYFNGVCVTLLKLPPMITTLGTMSIARGIAYTVTGGYPIGSLPDSYNSYL